MSKKQCLNDIGKKCVGYQGCDSESCSQVREYEHLKIMMEPDDYDYDDYFDTGGLVGAD